MRIAFIIVASMAGLGLVIWIVGSLLPVKHQATREATVAASPETLFALISTPAKSSAESASPQALTTSSISTQAPSGSAATPIVVRAGKG